MGGTELLIALVCFLTDLGISAFRFSHWYLLRSEAVANRDKKFVQVEVDG